MPKNDQARFRRITRAVHIGLWGNVVLAVAKIVVGVVSGSRAVLADGIDSASDVLISIVSLVAARIMSTPSDATHPYGHGRAETLATNLLASVIFLVGAQLCFDGIVELAAGTARELPTALALWVTLFSIGGKLLLAWQQHRSGSALQSRMLKANAINMRNDILTSVVVLLGLLATRFWAFPQIDRIFAIIVSIFIMRSAVLIFKEVTVELMDGNHNPALYQSLFDAVRQVPGAHNPHRVRIRRLANKYVVDLDIEVDSHISVMQGHEIASQVERAIRAALGSVYDVMVHVEPLGADCDHDPECFGLREDLLEP